MRDGNGTWRSLFPFPHVYMDKHAVFVDVRYLDAFLESEAQGVDSAQADPVVEHFDGPEDSFDLIATEDDRQLFFLFGTDKGEGCPFFFEGLGVEELNAAQGNGRGGSGPFSDILVVEEIPSELVFGNLVRRFCVVFGQLPNRTHVHFDSAFGHATKLHVLDHAFT